MSIAPLASADAQRLRTFASALLTALNVDTAPSILAALEEALVCPPTTTEAVGFYVGAGNNAFENCFRFLVSQLRPTRAVMAAEDKYSFEMFHTFSERGVASPTARQLFPMFFGEMDESAFDGDSGPGVQAAMVANLETGYAPMTAEIEAGFEALGSRLLSLWTIPGDTSYFIAVPSAFADAWANVPVGHDHEGQPMGVRTPAWGTFYAFLSYTLMLPDHPAPNGATDPAWQAID